MVHATMERDKIIKFHGCYHDHADMLLVQAGSGAATLALPNYPSVPKATVQDTLEQLVSTDIKRISKIWSVEVNAYEKSHIPWETESLKAQTFNTRR